MVLMSTDNKGPGSFDDMVEYVEAVLRENFVIASGGDQNEYNRRARNIVISLMNRQKIAIIPRSDDAR